MRLPVSRRLSACRRWLLGSSCARWGVTPSSRSAYRQESIAGPQRGCHVAHEQDSTGQGAPFTPGTVVRSRPAAVLRPAPAAFQRPVPTAPLTHPIGGGHLHEASSGVHSRSPITPRRPDAAPEPGSALASRRSSPRPQPPDGTAAASASTPGFAPRGHPQSTPRRRQALAHWPEYYTYRHQPNLQTVPPTSLMHPHVAPSHTSLPGPPQGSAPALAHHLPPDATGSLMIRTARELLPGFRLPYDHRPPPMQINPDELPAVILVHRGLPWFVQSEHPQHPPGTSRGAEAPLLHRINLRSCGRSANPHKPHTSHATSS